VSETPEELTRGGIYFAHVRPQFGQQEHEKERPVIVVDVHPRFADGLKYVAVVVTTKDQHTADGRYLEINNTHSPSTGTGLSETSFAALHWVILLDVGRVNGSLVGYVTPNKLVAIRQGMTWPSGLGP
jgi:mRNA-degrading endonuclease toxin of MazEF toxin-antitoxin module